MEDKELESQLKKSVEKIETKDFSERWEKIWQRVEPSSAMQEQFEPELVPIAETGTAPKQKRLYKKGLLLGGICMLLCAIILAITLPLTLGSGGSRYCYSISELYHRVSDQEEFYLEIERSAVSVPDLFECEIESYGLWVTEENETKGWELDYYDLANESSIKLDIYMNDVEVCPSIPHFTEKCSTTTVNGVSVQYLIEREDDAYLLWAIANYRNCGYRFEILSANENTFAVLETLFR